MSAGALARVRAFAALPVPAPARDRLSRAVDSLRAADDGWRWTRPEGWHITLAFLGEIPATSVDAAVAALEAAARAQGPIACSLADLGRFGRRVLWVGVEDDPPGAVAALGARVQDALEEREVPVRRQAVRPHLTLARARRKGPGIAVPQWQPPAVGWEASRIVLHRSRLEPDGARYEELASVSLAGD